MPLVTYLSPDGTRRTLDVPAGTTAMQAAVDAELPGIIGECGGAAMCATCHVYVEAGWEGVLPPHSEVEDAMLEFTLDERRPNSRLACQIRIGPALDGLVLRLPSVQA